MVVLNAILYRAQEAGMYVAHACELDQIGIQSTKEQAIKQLAQAIRIVVDRGREHPKTDLIGASREGKTRDGLTRILREAEKYKPSVHEIPDYNVTLHIYDLTDIGLSSPREKLPSITDWQWQLSNERTLYDKCFDYQPEETLHDRCF